MNAVKPLAGALLALCALAARADTVPFDLSTGPLTQDWSNAGLITANDDWSGVPSMVGFRGDGLAGATNVDPQTITAADDPGVIDVNANQANPNTFTTGGLSEFAIANPAIALAGSGTARAPQLRIYLDTTGRQNVSVAYTLRDLESAADNAAQQVALQYRVGNSGVWTNVPAAYVPDATDGPNLVRPDTAVSVILPSDVNDAGEVQLRILTSDAGGADEWVGIDDIVINSDDLGVPLLSVEDVSLAEGNAGITNFVFTFTLTGPAPADCDFSVENFGGTATPGVDFVAFSQDLTIPAGMLQTTLTVQVNGDTDIEPDETFDLDIFGEPQSCDIFEANATGTILNDDAATINLNIAAASVTEGNAGTVNLNLPVSLSAPAPAATSVPFTVIAGTATAGVDYQTTSGSVAIAAGATSAVATVVVNGDLLDENNETLTVNLGMPPVGYTVVTGSAIGTIDDDDAPPVISVSSPSVNEGNGGTTPMTFVISLSEPSGLDVAFTRFTSNGTATVGSDYVGVPAGNQTIPAGQTSVSVVVSINGDVDVEADETLLLDVVQVGNAIPPSLSGTGTILNDDATINLSIAAASVTEGNVGTVNLNLPVTLSAAAPAATSVPFTVNAGTATAGVDYQTTSGSVAIAAGATSGVATVVVNGDLLDESDETLTVTLGAPPPNYAVLTASAVGTLLDDDAPPTVSVSSPSVNEGNGGTTPMTFVVSLSAPSGLDVSFTRATTDGTATAGSDYVALPAASQTIPAGQTSANVVVSINGDFTVEPNETFSLNLSNVVNASPTAVTGTGTITNDDAVPLPPMLIPAGDGRGVLALMALLALFGALAVRQRLGH